MKNWHWSILGLLTLASFIIGMMYHDPHHNHFWDITPGFWMLFGAAGCAVLVYVAKIILAPIIYKKEDYYNHD